jgi:predicted O-methyltransferase YrrM
MSTLLSTFGRASQRVSERLRLARIPTTIPNLASLRSVSTAPTLQDMLTDLDAIAASAAVSAKLAPFDVPLEGTWGMNAGDRRALYHLVKGLRAQSVLEVGTNVGASTLWVAAALQEVAASPELITVDILDVNDGPSAPWRQNGLPQSPRDRLHNIGADVFTTFKKQPALEFLRTTNLRFDLVILDGDHGAEAVYQEIAAAAPLIRANGLIVLHDYFDGLRPLWVDANEVIAGPYLAARRYQREGDSLRVVPLGSLPWPTKHGSRNTSLAVVLRPGR